MTGGEPLVSVLVPVYNVEAYLPECIQSVLDQTYQNWQLILVDDGSTDKSGEICDWYRERDGRITVEHTPNRGVSHARNRALELAEGEWVAFLDSDDYFLPRALETWLRYSRDVDLVISANLILPDGITWRFSEEVCTFPTLTDMGEEIIPFYLKDRCICWRKLFRRERLTVRFHEKLLHYEDVYFFFEQLPLCRGIRIIPDTLYVHRDNNLNSLTHRFTIQSIRAGQDACEFLRNIFPDCPEVYRFGLRYFVGNHICRFVMNLSRLTGINDRIKTVLLEELFADPIYGRTAEMGITPFTRQFDGIWEAVVRRDPAAALTRGRELAAEYTPREISNE